LLQDHRDDNIEASGITMICSFYQAFRLLYLLETSKEGEQILVEHGIWNLSMRIK
jgi:hypothetical protein